MANVEVAGSSPITLASSRGRPISSSASRRAVTWRLASSSSRRPPGNEISPAWRRRSARRRVSTRWGSELLAQEQRARARRPGSRRGRLTPRGAAGTPSGGQVNPLNALLEHHVARRARGGRGIWPRSRAGARRARRAGRRAGEGPARTWSRTRGAAGLYSTVTSTWPRSQPLRWAYISIVIAVHDARLAASSSWGSGPASSPPAASGLVDDQLVIADLNGVPEPDPVPPCRRPHS